MGCDSNASGAVAGLRRRVIREIFNMIRNKKRKTRGGS